MNTLKTHPNDENLLFDVENGEITSVAYKGIDVTEFTIEYADYLFPQWEKELVD